MDGICVGFLLCFLMGILFDIERFLFEKARLYYGYNKIFYKFIKDVVNYEETKNCKCS